MSEDADFYSLNMECEHHNSKEDCYECAIASIRARWPRIDEMLTTPFANDHDEADYQRALVVGREKFEKEGLCPHGLFKEYCVTCSPATPSTCFIEFQDNSSSLGRIESMTEYDLQFLRDCGISAIEEKV